MAKPTPDNQVRSNAKRQTGTRRPPMFTVLMHNDDYTTMEFVVEALISVFRKSPTEANRIMLHIHFKGSGVCGTYPYEVAETRVARVHSLARKEGFPLRCSLEKV
ncbi:MAG: ATP-dependent Clp protease adaptor ClpS [Desulfuromonadales bacterium]